MKILFIVSDGMGDLPIKELGEKTPLEAAFTPNMDKMALRGKTGIMHVLKKGVTPTSDKAHLTLFGYGLKKHYVGRGPIEALGIGLDLKHGDIAFRANFGTVTDQMKIIDRRAGRIQDVSKLAEKVDNLKIKGIRFLVKPGTAHRAALIMRGPGLSARVSDGDPHKNGVKVQKIKPLDNSKEAKFTSKVLNEFLEKVHKILDKHSLNKERVEKGLLPGNYLLVRGAGKMKKVPSFEKKFGLSACCIAGAGLYKGVSRLVGMKILDVKGATGTPKTNIEAKIERAVKELNNFDFVFVHIKGCDVFGHDGDAIGKKQFIERIDKAIKPLLNLKDTLVVVTADHSTPCSKKNHSADPVPILFSGESVKRDSVKEFGESACRKGALGVLQGKGLMKKMKKEARLP